MDRKDDLKYIQGIGPAVEKRLNQAGIYTCAQLADLQSEEIALILNGMVGFSTERIADEDWVGQARDLQGSTVEEDFAKTGNPPGGMHYEIFTVEFLLDDDNQVRRTLIKDVQHQTPTSWAGWDAERLTSFFIEKAGLKIFTLSQSPVEALPIPEATIQLSSTQTTKTQTSETPTLLVDGKLQLQKMAFIVADQKVSSRHIRSEQPFAIRLNLDLRNIHSSIDQPLDYSVVIFTKSLSAEPRQLLAEKVGKLKLVDYVDLEIPNLQLAAGAYHLEAFVKLMPSGATPAQLQDLMAMTESGIVHVY